MKVLGKVFITLLMLVCYPAQADLQQALNDSLKSVTSASGGAVVGNATAPQIGESSQAGYVAGGSIYSRFKIHDANLIGFSSPYVKAGCSGIDMYGGSFSFINAEEFKNLLRSIGSNALGYAFKMGIDSMCPTCGNLMADFQQKVQELNQFLGNSCQLGQGLVNGGVDAWNNSREQDISLLSAGAGVADDAWASFHSKSQSGVNPYEQVQGSAAEARVNETIKGNLVWRAINKGANGAFKNGDDALYRGILSLTGTVVVDGKDGMDEGGTNVSSLSARTVPHIINLRDLVVGNEVSIYDCVGSSDADGCLEMTAVDTPFTNMITKVSNILVGNGSAPGLIRKYATNSGQLDADESFLIANTNGTALGVLLRNSAIAGEGIAENFVSSTSAAISLYYAYNTANELIEGAIASLKPFTAESPDVQSAIDLLVKRQIEIRDEYITLTKDYGSMSDIQSRYNDLITIAEAPTPAFYE